MITQATRHGNRASLCSEDFNFQGCRFHSFEIDETGYRYIFSVMYYNTSYIQPNTYKLNTGSSASLRRMYLVLLFQICLIQYSINNKEHTETIIPVSTLLGSSSFFSKNWMEHLNVYQIISNSQKKFPQANGKELFNVMFRKDGMA